MTTTVVNTIGSAGGRDYSTIALWEDATDNTSLVGADEIREGQLYNDSEFVITSGITMSGATVDSSRFRRLVAAAGQSFMDAGTKKGTYDVTKGVGIKTTTDYVVMLTILENYAEVKGLQFYNTASNGGGSRGALYAETISSGGLISNCIARTGGCRAIYLGQSVKAVNSLFILDNPHDSAVSFNYGSSPSGLYNCTIAMPSDGTLTGTCYAIAAAGGTQNAVIKNTGIFGGFTAASNGSYNAGSGFNATSFGSAPGSSNVTGLTLSSQFNAVTIAAQDFIMKSGSGMAAAGTRDATNTSDLDMFAAARSTSTPSIGANELIGGGGGGGTVIPVFMNQYRQRRT